MPARSWSLTKHTRSVVVSLSDIASTDVALVSFQPSWVIGVNAEDPEHYQTTTPPGHEGYHQYSRYSFLS